MLKKTLNKDLKYLNHYFKFWRLKPNPMKTVLTLFHLNNKMDDHKIYVFLDRQVIKKS